MSLGRIRDGKALHPRTTYYEQALVPRMRLFLTYQRGSAIAPVDRRIGGIRRMYCKLIGSILSIEGGVAAEAQNCGPYFAGAVAKALRTVQHFAPLHLCLMRSLATSGRRAVEIFAKCSGIERLAWRMNARCLA